MLESEGIAPPLVCWAIVTVATTTQTEDGQEYHYEEEDQSPAPCRGRDDDHCCTHWGEREGERERGGGGRRKGGKRGSDEYNTQFMGDFNPQWRV